MAQWFDLGKIRLFSVVGIFQLLRFGGLGLGPISGPLLDHQVLDVGLLLLVGRVFEVLGLLLPDEDGLTHSGQKAVAGTGKLRKEVWVEIPLPHDIDLFAEFTHSPKTD